MLALALVCAATVNGCLSVPFMFLTLRPGRFEFADLNNRQQVLWITPASATAAFGQKLPFAESRTAQILHAARTS